MKRSIPTRKAAYLLVLMISNFGILHYASAQCVQDANGRWVDKNNTNNDCQNAIPTAAPFLIITPDARSGALGDAGVALSPDANSIHKNISRTAFADDRFSLSATYSPWLKGLGLDDIYLAYLAGYYKLDEDQAVSGSIRYFSLGDIQFTDPQGNNQQNFRPNEFEIALGYARKLSDNLSLGATGKFILSDLASGQNVDGSDITAGIAGALDLGLYYKQPLNTATPSDLTVGLAFTNLGSKISYTKDRSDFLPSNLSLGAGYTWHLDDYNDFTITAEMNKLLVPTPLPSSHEDYDKDQNGIADHREKGFFEGVFGSFGDAPNGFSEELTEINWSVGMEYVYDDQFALRAGYFLEPSTKGNRRYATLGLGIRYNLTTINLSYLISTQNTTQASNPLDKTLRFSILISLDQE